MNDSTPPHPGIFVDEETMTRKELAAGVSAALAWGEKIMLSKLTLEPDGLVPEHSHPHEQAGICLEGRFELVVNSESRVIEAGQMYIIPGNAVHLARGLGARAVTLDIFSPIREDYLPEA